MVGAVGAMDEDSSIGDGLVAAFLPFCSSFLFHFLFFVFEIWITVL